MHTMRYIMTIVGVVLPLAAVFLTLRFGVNSVQAFHTGAIAQFQSVAQALRSAIG